MAKYLYDAWGNCTISSDTTNRTVANANPFRYRGYYFDEDRILLASSRLWQKKKEHVQRYGFVLDFTIPISPQLVSSAITFLPVDSVFTGGPMDYSLYEAILTRRMWLYGIFCALFTIGLLICLLWNAHTGSYKSKDSSTRQRIEDKITQWTPYILGVIGLAVCIWLGSSTVWKCSEDIKNQAYIIWEGDITVVTHGPTGGIWYLPDEEGVELESGFLSEGKYTGRVVYAEHSRIVLEYWVDGD